MGGPRRRAHPLCQEFRPAEGSARRVALRHFFYCSLTALHQHPDCARHSGAPSPAWAGFFRRGCPSQDRARDFSSFAPIAIDQSQFKTNETGLREISFVLLGGYGEQTMTDAQLALQAVSDAQQILEEYLEPRPRSNERIILDRLVEVLERPALLVAVDRMQRGS